MLDCVVSFYRREDLWAKVRSGLNKNKQHINEVIVVNDEPWVKTLRCPFPITHLDHDHDDSFGLARSNNEGVEAATSEYVICLDDDIVLAPQALVKMIPFLRPGRLVYGRIVNIKEDSDIADEPQASFWTPNRFTESGVEKTPLAVLLSQCCGGFFITHKDSHERMGGYNEDLTDRGYLDTDYALRWLQHFGPDSVGIGLGYAWHLDLQDHERGERNEEHIQRLYNQVLEAYPHMNIQRILL